MTGLQHFDAIVRHEPFKGLTVVFTDDGAAQVTDKRFDSFDTACGQQTLRKIEDHLGLRIEGYICEDSKDPLMSMWALVGLVHKHFGVSTDLVFPGGD